MHRSLIYDEIIQGSDRLRAEPISYLRPADHHDLDLRVDAYRDSRPWLTLIQQHGSTAHTSSNLESDTGPGPTLNSTPNLHELLDLTYDITKLRDRLDQLSDLDLNRIRAEIQYILLQESNHLLDNNQIPVPVDLIQRYDAGQEPFLQVITMSMFSCGDQEPVSPYAAILISDYLQHMISNTVADLARPIQFCSLQLIFPRQASIFQKWRTAKQHIRSAASDLSDSEIDNDHLDHNLQHNSDCISQPDSFHSFQIQDYIDLDNDKCIGNDSVLYEIEAPDNYPTNFKIGPKVRRNFNRIREQNMSLDQYQHYSRCRQASLVSRSNRSKFLSWISLQRNEIASGSVESVITLLGLIAHDHIGAIVELGKGLQDHPEPLTVVQVQDAISAMNLIQYDIGPRMLSYNLQL